MEQSRHLKAMALALAVCLGSADAEAGMYRGYETPDYVVERSDGAVELRRYAPYLAAEVTVTGSQRQAIGKGFRALAGYIFGGNTSKTKVAMTAPVTQSAGEKIAMTSPVTQVAGNGAWTVRFMMPKDYTASSLPDPENAAIRIVTVTPGKRLAMTFSGLTSAPVLRKNEAALRGYAQAQGLTVAGPVEIAYFDDPFTLPWRRRNELSLPVE